MSTTFVSIASYCDSLLKPTIEDALDNARYPDNLRFGVVEQSKISYVEQLTEKARKQVRLLTVNPAESRGACWARALAMAMYGDEDWFFQIDAHTIFDKHWDACLVSSWFDCSKQSAKPYISGYPHSYEIRSGEVVKCPYTENIVVNVVSDKAEFPPSIVDVPFVPAFVDQTEPVKGFHLAGGCTFAPGKFVYEVPYDPAMYFHGEESLMALRAYTHGWDVFHVPKIPVYHYYDTGPEIEVARTRHWAEEEDGERNIRWWELNSRAEQRMTRIINGENFGVYGLGNVRTLEEYAEFSGIDYKNRVIHPKAYVGPWHKGA